MKSLLSLIYTLLFFICLMEDGAVASLTCDKPNEEKQCGSACQTECATLDEPCPIINKECHDACYCKEGYARDLSDKCILQSDCPRN